MSKPNTTHDTAAKGATGATRATGANAQSPAGQRTDGQPPHRAQPTPSQADPHDQALVQETTLDSVAGEEDPGASLDMVAPVVEQKRGSD